MLADYFSSMKVERREDGQEEEKNGKACSDGGMEAEGLSFVTFAGSPASLYEVDNQPLLLNEHLVQFNIRKLSELPHALAKSGRYAYEALTELLLDYQWIKACLLSLPCRDILHDFTPVIATVPIGRY